MRKQTESRTRYWGYGPSGWQDSQDNQEKPARIPGRHQIVRGSLSTRACRSLLVSVPRVIDNRSTGHIQPSRAHDCLLGWERWWTVRSRPFRNARRKFASVPQLSDAPTHGWGGVLRRRALTAKPKCVEKIFFSRQG